MMKNKWTRNSEALDGLDKHEAHILDYLNCKL